jgi:hypothetical protein
MKDKSRDKSRHKIDGWKLAVKVKQEDLERTMNKYEELQTETLVVRVNRDECGDCTKCFITGKEIIYRVYVRNK